MSKKGILYILLVVGLAVIGCGVWMLAKSPPEIVIPEGNPVIYERITHIMRGQSYELFTYNDGSMIYIEEKGLRLPGDQPTRIWKTGKLTAEQLDSLLAYFENSGLDKLDEYYNFPGKPTGGGGFTSGDMDFIISINSENLSKTVNASHYLTPDLGETYPDMPSPLNDIYGRLRNLAMTTQEVYSENIDE